MLVFQVTVTLRRFAKFLKSNTIKVYGNTFWQYIVHHIIVLYFNISGQHIFCASITFKPQVDLLGFSEFERDD